MFKTIGCENQSHSQPPRASYHLLLIQWYAEQCSVRGGNLKQNTCLNMAWGAKSCLLSCVFWKDLIWCFVEQLCEMETYAWRLSSWERKTGSCKVNWRYQKTEGQQVRKSPQELCGLDLACLGTAEWMKFECGFTACVMFPRWSRSCFISCFHQVSWGGFPEMEKVVMILLTLMTFYCCRAVEINFKCVK